MPKKQTSVEERRDSIRVRRVTAVHHRLIKHKNRKVNSVWQLATAENMSLSGLLFVSALVYQPDDIIELRVVMAGVLDIFNGFGKVVRVFPNKDGYYQIGVKYVDLKSKSRSAKTFLASS